MIQPGDEFAVHTTGLPGKLIRLRDRLRSPDGHAEFNHCGIVTGSDGTTFESRRTIKHYNINMYAGRRVIIARANEISTFAREASIRRIVKRHNGKTYPWWRIGLHAISPTLARWLHYSGVPVCSELVAEYRYLIGTRHDKFYGTTPDMLVDEWRHWREYEIIFDGIWPAGEPQAGPARSG